MGRQSPFIRVPAATPAEAIMTLLGQLDRSAIEGTIDALIEKLDRLDGDPDLEAAGDEQDGNFGEDDFCDHNRWVDGPGCPIADPGGADSPGDDDAEVDGFEARRLFLNRVRIRACYRVTTGIYEGRHFLKAGRGLA